MTNAGEHSLDILDRRVGQNAVAEIEDEGLRRKGVEHVVDCAIECGTASQQDQRIEIALHRPPALNLLARERPVDHPIEPDRIDLDLVDIARQRCAGAAGFFRELHAAGGDVMGVDWRINIDQAWMDISYRSAVQGNLDPLVLLVGGAALDRAVDDVLEAFAAKPFIFNLGHGILPETPIAHVEQMLARVRGR